MVKPNPDKVDLMEWRQVLYYYYYCYCYYYCYIYCHNTVL